MIANGQSVGIMNADLAKRIVKFVDGHHNITWSEVEENIPELKNRPDLREFAAEGGRLNDNGFLVKINNNGIVTLGQVAYLIG